MPGTVAITFSDAAGRDSAVSAGTPLPVTAGGATPAGQTPPASEAPVPIGGRYNLTSPTLPDGARGEAQMDSRGNLLFALRDAGGTGSAQVGAPTDAFSNANGGLTGNARGLAFNGTTWDRTRGDVNGTVVQSGAMAASRWNYPAVAGGIASSAAEFTIIAAAGTGVRNYLSSLILPHDLLSAGVEFVIRDGAAGAILYRSKLQTPATEGVPYVPPSPLRGTANTAMIGQLLTAVTGGVYVNASGFVGV